MAGSPNQCIVCPFTLPRGWRVGRKVGRTLYVGDALIGLMDTPQLAEQVVSAVAEAARFREALEAIQSIESSTWETVALTCRSIARRALTGPIPAAEPCAGCLPAEGDYGDGPPPMVLGRHVEGCRGAESAPTETTKETP